MTSPHWPHVGLRSLFGTASDQPAHPQLVPASLGIRVKASSHRCFGACAREYWRPLPQAAVVLLSRPKDRQLHVARRVAAVAMCRLLCGQRPAGRVSFHVVRLSSLRKEPRHAIHGHRRASAPRHQHLRGSGTDNRHACCSGRTPFWSPPPWTHHGPILAPPPSCQQPAPRRGSQCLGNEAFLRIRGRASEFHLNWLCCELSPVAAPAQGAATTTTATPHRLRPRPRRHRHR